MSCSQIDLVLEVYLTFVDLLTVSVFQMLIPYLCILSLCLTTMSWSYIVIDLIVLCQRYEGLDGVIGWRFLAIFHID